MTHIEYEKQTVEKMIRLYCRHKEGNTAGGVSQGRERSGNMELCADCQTVLDYAMARLDHCRFGNAKPTCKKCPVHCYKPEMKERIRQIMRWSGPRMMLYHPIDGIRHVLREFTFCCGEIGKRIIQFRHRYR